MDRTGYMKKVEKHGKLGPLNSETSVKWLELT